MSTINQFLSDTALSRFRTCDKGSFSTYCPPKIKKPRSVKRCSELHVKKTIIAYKCSHGMITKKCHQCNPAVCIHGREHVNCITCHGANVCNHDILRNECIVCNSNNVCIHRHLRVNCTVCNTCKHDIDRSGCVECNPSLMCSHDTLVKKCHICNPTTICIHAMQVNRCNICATRRCIHNNPSATCTNCNIIVKCAHNRAVRTCMICDVERFCIHKIHQFDCKDCDGRNLCRTPHCTEKRHKQYNGYCKECCITICPEIRVSYGTKSRENEIVHVITERFSDYTWISDRRVEYGCSARRPDLYCDFGDFAVIIECDENQHIGYNISCDERRIMELSRDIGHKPLTFIRINPDGYTDDRGIRTPSPWIRNKNGILILNASRRVEWNTRMDILCQTIRDEIAKPAMKTIHCIHLYFDEHLD